MKKYLVNMPDSVKEFWRKREQEVYAEEHKLREIIKNSPVVLTSDGTLPYAVNNLYYQNGVACPVRLDINLQCMFNTQSVFIWFTPKDNVLYGKCETHILMRTELVYDIMDIEIVEVNIPLSKVSKEVRNYISELQKRVLGG